jgi:copper(I)-binding protein
MSILLNKTFSILIVFLSVSTYVKADHINVYNAWSPETAPVARVMAAYMAISNQDKDDSFITGISSPQFNKVEIHSMSHVNGMMRMEKQGRLKLSAGKTTSLQPGGYHMMLFKPKKWYPAGSKITLNITLDDKNTFRITVPVIKDQGNQAKHH